jgi:hypothetical protein
MHGISLALAFILGAIALVATVKNTCGLPLGTSQWLDREKISAGYILLAPFYSDTNFDEPGVVNLIDADGEVRHTWKTHYPALMSYLQPDGTLFAAMTPPVDINDYPSAGSTGMVQQLDWDGAVLWEYADHQMTHDFEVMPDGGIAYIRWHRASPAFASRIRGGLQLATTSVWTNEIIVVNRAKEIAWNWTLDGHLNPRDFVLSPLIARSDWAHVNSIRYVPDNPLSHTPAFLVSARNISTVFLIDYPSGKVLWRSPANMFALQHDATLTDAGTILVFDNGLLRVQPKAFVASRVVEVDPKTNEIIWDYDGGRTPLEKIQFASSIMGGAERLANGNTLISASMLNTVLEVTPAGEIAGKYTNDFRDTEGRMHTIFKARKYAGGTWESRLSRNTSLAALVCQR